METAESGVQLEAHTQVVNFLLDRWDSAKFDYIHLN